MKRSAKQQREVFDHMKRHGVSFEAAKTAVDGGYGTREAERAEMYASRRTAYRAMRDEEFAVLPAILASAVRGRR